VHFKAENPRDVLLLRLGRKEVREDLKQDVRQRGAKVSPIQVTLYWNARRRISPPISAKEKRKHQRSSYMPARSWVVNILALWAVNLHRLGLWDVGHSHRQNLLSIAKNPWTAAKVALLVFLSLKEEERKQEEKK